MQEKKSETFQRIERNERRCSSRIGRWRRSKSQMGLRKLGGTEPQPACDTGT